MGQAIEITSTTLIDDVAMFATDRAITGQEGSGFDDLEAAEAAATFPARLAARLFEGDDAIDRVFVASNQVVARRREGWSDRSASDAAETISRFFVFYADT